MPSWSTWRADRGSVWLAAVLAMAATGCVSDPPQVTSCVLGSTECAGECVTLSVTSAHCGTCGNACAAGESCLSGSCLCIGETCDGTCVDTVSHPQHCGGCGTACAPGRHCSEGVCRAVCSDGLSSCDDRCVDVATDREHCGACDAPCPPGADCIAQSCTCREGLVSCGDSCVDTSRDGLHCGGCDSPCPAGELCQAGSCATACGSTACQPGEAAWGRRAASATGDAQVVAIATGSDGGAVVAGHFQGTLDLGGGVTAEATGQDFFVARFDALGRPQWVRRFGGTGVNQTMGGLALDGASIVFGGTLSGTVDFDGTALSATNLDAVVVRLDDMGVVVAAESFGGGNAQRITDVAARPGGGLAIVGRFRAQLSRGALALASDDVMNDDGFVLALDSAGNLDWHNVVADPGVDTNQSPLAVDVGSDGSVAVVARLDGGETAQWAGQAVGGAGSADSAVALFTSAGAVTWISQLAGAPFDVLDDVLVRDGEVVAVGHFGGSTGTVGNDGQPCPGPFGQLISDGGRDGLVLGLGGALGCPQWGRLFGGPDDTRLLDVDGEASGPVAVAGYFSGTLTDGSTLATAPLPDSGVVALVDPTATTPWATTFGATACTATGCAVATSPAHPWVLVGGTYAGTVHFRGSAMASAEGEDGFLARLAR